MITIKYTESIIFIIMTNTQNIIDFLTAFKTFYYLLGYVKLSDC